MWKRVENFLLNLIAAVFLGCLYGLVGAMLWAFLAGAWIATLKIMSVGQLVLGMMFVASLGWWYNMRSIDKLINDLENLP